MSEDMIDQRGDEALAVATAGGRDAGARLRRRACYEVGVARALTPDQAAHVVRTLFDEMGGVVVSPENTEKLIERLNQLIDEAAK